MEIAQIDAFLEAARRGSFRRAAEGLHLSQPSISARVQSLEQELGGPLFHRMGRGVRLTEMGSALLPYAQRAVDSLEEGREVVGVARYASGGMLRLGSARAIGTYTLPDMLDRFRARHPDIKVHIRVGRSTDVLEMVLDDEVQMGLARRLDHPDIVTIHLYDEHIVLVTHPDHPFASGGEVRISDVAREPMILYDPGSEYFALIEEVCREAEIEPQVEMTLDSIEATKHMVERGLGISFLPRSGIAQEVAQGTLAMVPLPHGQGVILESCAMIHRVQSYALPVVAFLRVLQEMYMVEVPTLDLDGSA